jgi:outer membrane protein insertion porin family
MDSPIDLDQQARIAAVRIEGAKNTRRAFLSSLVHPHLQQYSSASSFESVLRTTRDIGHYLVQTDLFNSVHARLEPSAEPTAKQGDVDVIFTALRAFLVSFSKPPPKSATARAPQCVSTLYCLIPTPRSPLTVLIKSATSRIRNVFGGAETFEANVSFGTKTRRSFHAAFTAPITHTLDTHGELSIFAHDRDNTSYMSATETLRGARAVIRVRRVRVSSID